MTREPIRVPGFPSEETAASSPGESRPQPALSTRAGAKQLNVRILLPLRERYKRLLRDLDDQGFDTTMSELVQALLHDGPTATDDAKRLIRKWRRALDPDL
jgi:hypothetical protein